MAFTATAPLESTTGSSSRRTTWDRFHKMINICLRMKDLTRSKNKRKEEMEQATEDICTVENVIKHTLDQTTHGPEAMAQALVTQAASMIETRIFLEYGDYVPSSLRDLQTQSVRADYVANLQEFRRQSVSNELWRNRDWAAVAPEIKKEQEAMEPYLGLWWSVDKARPKTPYLNALDAAATQLNQALTADQLASEIHSCAQRCEIADTGVESLGQECNFIGLSNKVVADLNVVSKRFDRISEHGKGLRRTIKRCGEDWFEEIWKTEDGRVASYDLSEKGKACQEGYRGWKEVGESAESDSGST